MKEKSKPCPFCGSEEVGIYQVNAEKTYFRVVCKNNKLQSGWNHPHVEGPLAETEKKAVAAWNTRVSGQKELIIRYVVPKV